MTQERRPVRQYEVVVTDVIRETADAVTLELFAPGPVEYEAGQYLTIDPHQFPALRGLVQYLEQQKGKEELVRAYSLSSAPHERRLAFTVKVEPYVPGVTPYPPLLSPLLTYGLRPGATLEVSGFAGTYTLAPDLEQRVERVLHLVAGSGSVPNLSMLKWDLETRSRLKHTFVYSNRTHAEVIFRAQLDALARRFPARLELLHLLTREPDASALHGPGYRSARIDAALLEQLIPDPAAVECYCCGPGITLPERKAALARGEKPAPRFLEAVVDLLKQRGVDRKRIHQEAFG